MAKKTKKKAKRSTARPRAVKGGAKKAAKRGRRTTMYSTGGKKLYAVRDSEGKFKDIQTYKRAHAADLRRKSAAELEGK